MNVCEGYYLEHLPFEHREAPPLEQSICCKSRILGNFNGALSFAKSRILVPLQVLGCTTLDLGFKECTMGSSHTDLALAYAVVVFCPSHSVKRVNNNNIHLKYFKLKFEIFNCPTLNY